MLLHIHLLFGYDVCAKFRQDPIKTVDFYKKKQISGFFFPTPINQLTLTLYFMYFDIKMLIYKTRMIINILSNIKFYGYSA